MKSNSVLCADIATPMQKKQTGSNNIKMKFSKKTCRCTVSFCNCTKQKGHTSYTVLQEIFFFKFHRLVTVRVEKSPSGQQVYTGSQSCLKALILPPHTALSCQEIISTQNWSQCSRPIMYTPSATYWLCDSFNWPILWNKLHLALTTGGT